MLTTDGVALKKPHSELQTSCHSPSSKVHTQLDDSAETQAALLCAGDLRPSAGSSRRLALFQPSVLLLPRKLEHSPLRLLVQLCQFLRAHSRSRGIRNERTKHRVRKIPGSASLGAQSSRAEERACAMSR